MIPAYAPSLPDWMRTVAREVNPLLATTEDFSVPDETAFRYFRRNANHTGGTVGWVSCCVRAETYVSNGDNNYEWTILGVNDNSATGGQNVAVYGQAIKRTTGPTWAATFEARDLSGANPTGGCTGIEIDVSGNGGDAGGTRVALDIVGYKADSAGATATIGWAMRVLPENNDPTNAVFTYGIDLSGATFNNAAIRLGRQQIVNLESTGTLQLQTCGPTDSIVKLNNGGVETVSFDLAAPALRVNAKNVVGPQIGAWGTSTGGVRGPIAASTATLAQVAAGIAQLLEDLKRHGLFAA